MSHNSDKGPQVGRAVNVRDCIIPAQPGQQSLLPGMMTGSQAKTAYALRKNVEDMIAGDAKRRLVRFDYSDGKSTSAWIADKPENLNCTGFLTLTVGDIVEGRFQGVRDAAEASRRINNLNRRVLPELFERAIVVTERMKSGVIHFHVLGILRGRPDIRTGLDFDALARRDYRSASPALRGIWAMLRSTLPEYGFGRAELLPVRKTSEAVACYISKYIEKNLCNRQPQDKRKKLVRYIGFEKRQLKPNQFAWATKRAIAWRAKTRETAALIGCESPEQAAEALGPRWAFHLSAVWTKIDDAPVPFMQWDYAVRVRAAMELEKITASNFRLKRDWKNPLGGGFVPVFERQREIFDRSQLRQIAENARN